MFSHAIPILPLPADQLQIQIWFTHPSLLPESTDSSARLLDFQSFRWWPAACGAAHQPLLQLVEAAERRGEGVPWRLAAVARALCGLWRRNVLQSVPSTQVDQAAAASTLINRTYTGAGFDIALL